MKRIVMLMLCLCLIFGLTACNDTKTPVKSEPPSSSSGDTSSAPEDTSSKDTSSAAESQPDEEEGGGWGDFSPEDDDSFLDSEGNINTGSGNVSVSKTIPAMTSESDRELLRNPNRGFRLETTCNVSNIPVDGLIAHPNPSSSLMQFKEFYMAENPQLAQVYFYLTGYKNTMTIPKEGLDRIQQFFDDARDYRVMLLVRFTYQTDMTGKGEATQTIMMAHMKQLKPILEKNKDIIYVVQSGFLGAWGEWHSNTLDIDKTALLRGIIDMSPVGKYIQMRLPSFKNLIPKTEPIYNWLSFENDSVFGEAAGGTGGVDPGTVPWQQITDESPFLPVDGELFWGRWSINMDDNTDGKLIDGFKVIKELSEHHFSSLSIHHNYIEDNLGKYSMVYWQETEITESWLKKNNIIFAPNWFKDSSGSKVPRTLFDFVRDYLGYKLEARSFKVTGKLVKGGSLSVELGLVNYGFSIPFGMESGFAVLDSDDKVVSTVKAGNPMDWQPRSTSDYYEGRLLPHTVKASLKVPDTPGKYRIAFYMKNDINAYARLGNDIDFVNGYNVLGTFG